MKTVENGHSTPQLFSTFIFKYEIKNENGKAGHANECELTKYREFWKTNQFERNYVEHGQYTKIQYGIPIHNA
jgi:hypothetical protein